MNAIRQWTVAVTLSAVACTILETLAPNKKFEKIIRLVLGVFMLCAILLPLKDTIKNVSFNLDKNTNFFETENDFKNNVNEKTQEEAKRNIEKMILETLKGKDIEVKKINIFMDMKEDNCISISKAEIYLSNNDRKTKEEVSSLVEKTFGIKNVLVLGSG